MNHLKAAGIIAIVLIGLPFLWQGYGDLSDLREAAGPACIVNGDTGQRIALLDYPGQSVMVEVGRRSDGRCQINQGSDDDAEWQIVGEYYIQTSAYEAGNPFPAPTWDWPITLTWDDGGLTTLSATGWLGSVYRAVLSIAPFAALFTALGLAGLVWIEPDYGW